MFWRRWVNLYEDRILGAAIKSKRRAFTLTEIMVVVIILGVMASFVLPNYTKSIDRGYRRDAETQLTTIWSADQIYRSQNGQYWPSDNNSGAGYDITAINNTLGLGIIPNGMTYSCVGAAPDATHPFGSFTCTAVRGPFTITITEAQINDSNPSCSGTCP